MCLHKKPKIRNLLAYISLNRYFMVFNYKNLAFLEFFTLNFVAFLHELAYFEGVPAL